MKRDPVFTPPSAWMQAGFLAQVVSLDDPDRRNRVQVKLLAFDDVAEQETTMWARVVAPFAGDDRGVFFLPDVDDEVFVVFVQGDPRLPVILGGLWNGASKAPADIESGGVNRFKRIKTKNGIVITLDDKDGQETLEMKTPAGQTVTLQDGPGTVTVGDSNGNSIKLDPAAITLKASGLVKVEAPMVMVKAGLVKVDAAMSKFSGMIKCDVLQTNAVISSSYTPGAGNVW